MRQKNRANHHLTHLLRTNAPAQKKPQARSRLAKKTRNRHHVTTLRATTQHQLSPLRSAEKRNSNHKIRSLTSIPANNESPIIPCTSIQSPRNLIHITPQQTPRQTQRNKRRFRLDRKSVV